MSIREQACATRRAACDAAELEAAHRAVVEAAEQRQERSRQFNGAVSRLEAEFGDKPDVDRVEHVTHERTVKQHRYKDTVREPAVEFVIDGLRLRVVERKNTRYNGSYTMIDKDRPYKYDLLVWLPARKRTKLGRKPRSWYNVRNAAHLGALLIDRGMCS